MHDSVYTDPDIVKLKMHKIFAGTWVYVAHVSEVTQPGDSKTA